MSVDIDRTESSLWVYDCAHEYNVYYGGGVNSIYYQLYKDRFLPYDHRTITKLAYELATTRDSLTIMDFGCGNGRYFPIFEQIASHLDKQHKSLTIIAYDPSKEAISSFSSKLQLLGFTQLNQLSSESDYSVACFQKGNIVVKMIRPLQAANMDRLIAETGNIDITVCMFGVISHIQTKQARIATIKQLGEITTGQILISVPSYRILKEERKAFEVIRKHKFRLQVDGKPLKLEEGDILYARNYENIHVENFLHLYSSADEIIEEIHLAGLKLTADFNINRIAREATMMQKPILGYIDKYLCCLLSNILPRYIKNKIAGYYLISCKK
jgi:SAM-dependent methyltransferase